MNSLLRELLAKKARLEMAILSAKQFMETAPDGRLRINNRIDSTRYYQVLKKRDTSGVYISSKNSTLISQLAQKDYVERFLKEAQHELKCLQTCISALERHDSEAVFSKLSQQRQELVTPLMRDDEKCTQSWLALPFQASSYEPNEKIFRTKRGEMVRSKSELMIADMYYELGIPYRYECEVTLPNGEKKSPDFTLFHAPRRMVIYHEHLGRMDEEDYVNRNLKKLKEYGEIGIYSGKNLILTLESKKRPFNLYQFREQIKEIFWLK